ncbi:MAG: glycosyltransferase [Salinibacterium sp.]|nr:glycosyltransferase [Salinibacterium sp.]
MKDAPRVALVACYSLLESDPRVTRQIDWLVSAGYTVDTVGLGGLPRPTVRRHYAIRPLRGLLAFRLVRLGIHVLLPRRARFAMLEQARIPRELRSAHGSYDLIVANEIDLLPWVTGVGQRLLATGGRTHVDLHEYHRWAGEGSGRLATSVFGGYHSWLLSRAGSPVVTSRSTVADKLADLYATDFGVARPSVVRNSPARVELDPRPVDPNRIELVYHGFAELARGLHLLVDAMRLSSSRFRLNLMLTGGEEAKHSLAAAAADLGDRVRIVPAVAMDEVSRAINEFDLEVVFIPPTTLSFEYALPNKFFEAVQGRVGLIIGNSPSMVEITTHYGNGVVVDGWTAADLARTLDALDVETVTRLKQASVQCANDLNSEHEGRAFLASVAGQDASTPSS